MKKLIFLMVYGVISVYKLFSLGNVYNTGIVINTGTTLSFSGNFYNSGMFLSSGTEIFLGDSNQYLYGTFHGSRFGNVLKQNSGNLISTTSLPCLSFSFETDGLLEIPDYDSLIITNNSPHALQGCSPLRFVNTHSHGFISRKISSAGRYDFPLGNTNIGYKGISFDIQESNSLESYVSGQLYQPSGSVSYQRNYPSCDSFGTQFVQLVALEQHGWSFEGSPTVFVAFATPSDYGSAMRRVITSPQGSGLWSDYVTHTVGDTLVSLCSFSDWTGHADSVPGGPYRQFQDFAIAGSGDITLPLTLTSIKASPDKESVQVTWETASEFSLYGFYIEKSIDALIFSQVGFVEAHSSQQQPPPYHYFFQDKEVLPHTLYYYRIIGEDYDGTTHVSQIVSVRTPSQEDNVLIAPNPAQEFIHLLSSTELPAGSLIHVTTMDGTILQTHSVTHSTRSMEISCPFPPGIYLITLQQQGIISHYRFVLI